MKLKLMVGCLLGLLLICAPIFAHHGTSVTYQTDKTITISGTVTEFSFSYPHPQLRTRCDSRGNVIAYDTASA